MLNCEKEKAMKKMFEKQASMIINNQDIFRKNGDNVRIGFESEVSLFNEGASVFETGQARDKVLQAVGCDFYDTELGVTQIEIKTPPIYLSDHGFGQIVPVYKEKFQKILETSKQFDFLIARIGSNPFFPTVNVARTNKAKYQTIPDYHNFCKRKFVKTELGMLGEKVNVADASVVSLFQSFQINIEARSVGDAVDKMNRSLMIGPYIAAISGNSRYLVLKDTGFNDIRLPAWEASHDTRTKLQFLKKKDLRVGLPSRYFKSINNYFDRIKKFPFILFDIENAFGIGIGLTWLDTRIKFINNSAVVEFRLIPTQPEIEDEIILTEFYVGRLLYSQYKKEPLMSISMVRENRSNSFLFGLNADYWYLDDNCIAKKDKGQKVLEAEIEKAMVGLDLFSLSSNSKIEKLFSRLEKGSPSESMAKTLKGEKIIKRKDMIDAMITHKMLV